MGSYVGSNLGQSQGPQSSKLSEDNAMTYIFASEILAQVHNAIFMLIMSFYIS